MTRYWLTREQLVNLMGRTWPSLRPHLKHAQQVDGVWRIPLDEALRLHELRMQTEAKRVMREIRSLGRGRISSRSMDWAETPRLSLPSTHQTRSPFYSGRLTILPDWPNKPKMQAFSRSQLLRPIASPGMRNRYLTSLWAKPPTSTLPRKTKFPSGKICPRKSETPF